ncbi:MAG: Gfo/Idh/MocA family oxidoreductase [Actinobacteria bacterium]|nr:Gfo/Idh/MocA family oxidoreductase [Actinomycetota bacterium]
MRAAVVGTGFIGVVHVEALRRLGIEVTGVVGSSPERAAAKPGLPDPYESFEAMLADARVDVVHLTTPNHLHHPQVKAVLASGKHVVCEKPLALSSVESAELLELAGASGLVHCTNYNIRFYSLCREARERVARGDLGTIWNAHGTYLQDWLQQPTDWNWRLDPAQGGSLRAVADIGTHWLDLIGWITGRRVAAVFADLSTVHDVRQVPTGPVETFSTGGGEIERVDRKMDSEDAAHILLRYEDGTRGQVTISQVSAGRRNHVSFELDGSGGALAWNSERHEELWLGHRDRPNELLLRDPGLMSGGARGGTDYPGGHAEGFPDTFKQLYRAVYRAVEAGGMPAEPDFPTFVDGHEEILLGEAIAESAATGTWTEVAR